MYTLHDVNGVLLTELLEGMHLDDAILEVKRLFEISTLNRVDIRNDGGKLVLSLTREMVAL